MSRWIRFFLAILVGASLGLLYGWVINPVEYVDTTPDTLKSDYKADYVLMVAEAHHRDGDLSLAVKRLALLGETPPILQVYQASLLAERAGYSDADLTLIKELLGALQASQIGQETPP
jgi:hypothetical protein